MGSRDDVTAPIRCSGGKWGQPPLLSFFQEQCSIPKAPPNALSALQPRVSPCGIQVAPALIPLPFISAKTTAAPTQWVAVFYLFLLAGVLMAKFLLSWSSLEIR